MRFYSKRFVLNEMIHYDAILCINNKKTTLKVDHMLDIRGSGCGCISGQS